MFTVFKRMLDTELYDRAYHRWAVTDRSVAIPQVNYSMCVYSSIITALHAVALHATRSSHEKAGCPSVSWLFVRPSVRLSVRLSVKRVNCDKKKKKVLPKCLYHYKRSFILVFWEENCLVRGNHFYLKFWVKLTPLEWNSRFSVDIRS